MGNLPDSHIKKLLKTENIKIDDLDYIGIYIKTVENFNNQRIEHEYDIQNIQYLINNVINTYYDIA